MEMELSLIALGRSLSRWKRTILAPSERMQISVYMQIRRKTIRAAAVVTETPVLNLAIASRQIKLPIN